MNDTSIDTPATARARRAKQTPSEIDRSFREKHPELLDDPLAELPEHLRRFIARLEPLDQEFGVGEVRAHFHVTDRSARDWLKSWGDGGFIEPTKPGAQRVHRYRIRAEWLRRLVGVAEAARRE
jgi:hypothetical protein